LAVTPPKKKNGVMAVACLSIQKGKGSRMGRKIKEVRDVARLDIYRDKRCGIPEVILAEGKEPKWVAELLIAMTKEKGIAIATRVDKECLKEVKYPAAELRGI
jgi:hypothetical protein